MQRLICLGLGRSLNVTCALVNTLPFAMTSHHHLSQFSEGTGSSKESATDAPCSNITSVKCDNAKNCFWKPFVRDHLVSQAALQSGNDADVSRRQRDVTQPDGMSRQYLCGSKAISGSHRPALHVMSHSLSCIGTHILQSGLWVFSGSDIE